MLIKRKQKGYSSRRKYIHGRGFVDTVHNVVANNRDLIVKPLLEAAGQLSALALTKGGKAILNKITNKTNDSEPRPVKPLLDPKANEILRNITPNIMHELTPVSNIVGSGLKTF